MTSRVFLVRHGETEYNRRGLALGRADAPLNETGRRQAERLREALAGAPVVAVYASPLVRAFDTAASIAAAHGKEVVVENGLIEMDIGEVEGLTFPEVRKQFPALAQNWGGRMAQPSACRVGNASSMSSAAPSMRSRCLPPTIRMRPSALSLTTS